MYLRFDDPPSILVKFPARQQRSRFFARYVFEIPQKKHSHVQQYDLSLIALHHGDSTGTNLLAIRQSNETSQYRSLGPHGDYCADKYCGRLLYPEVPVRESQEFHIREEQ